MSISQTSEKHVQAGKKPQKVTVTLAISTTEDGQTQKLKKVIPGGPTKVPVLKQELEVPRTPRSGSSRRTAGKRSSPITRLAT